MFALFDWVESVVVILKESIPAIHPANLVFVLFLPAAFVNVALGPLSVASCDLFDADSWVFAVVAILVKVWVGSAVWEGRVEEAARRSTESLLHSKGIVAELVDPFCLRRKLGKVLKQDFFGKLIQTIKTLLRCSWRNLIVFKY